MRGDITVAEIAERLAGDAENVVRHLLPNAKRNGAEMECGDVYGSEGKSLRIRITGEKAGVWADFSDPTNCGDILDLWRVVRGLTPGQAVLEAKQYLGIREPAFQRSRPKYAPPPEKKTERPNPDGIAWRFLTEKRKLSKSVLEAYRVEVDPTSRAIVFPSYSPSGELVNRSYRTLPREGEKKKVWQDTDCAPSMWGWHTLTKDDYARRSILITEGQIDAMTWHQWGVAALSIPNGGGSTWIEYDWDNLAAFDTIYVSFDMDGAGRKNAEKAIQRLGLHRCLLVEISGGKDANEALQNGIDGETAKEWLKNAKAPVFKGLVKAADLFDRVEALCHKTEPAFTHPIFDLCWPDRGLYFRPGEVTVWTGISSHGKSTFLGWLMLCSIAVESTVFIASLEMPAEKTVWKMIPPFIGCPMYCITPTNVANFIGAIGDKIVLADKVGYITQDELFEMMRFAHQRYGCSHFMVDSLMRIDGLEEEYVEQGRFMNKLQEFAKETGGHIHLVSHPKKIGPDGQVTIMDVKGSSGIINNTDNLVVVSRNTEKMKRIKDGASNDELSRMWDTEIRVEKQRESGWIGSFHLAFDYQSHDFRLFGKSA